MVASHPHSLLLKKITAENLEKNGTDEPNLQGRSSSADVANRLWTRGEGEGGVN